MDFTVDPSVNEGELTRKVLDDIDVVYDKDVAGLKVEDDVDAVKLRRDCEDVMVAVMTVIGDDDVDVVLDVGEDVDVVELRVNVMLELVANESPMQITATSSWCPQS